MNESNTPSDYWLNVAKQSLKEGNTYSAIREFIGSINRSIASKNSVNTLKTINHVINYLTTIKELDILYAVLKESLASFKKTKRFDLIEETLLSCYKAVEKLEEKCERLLEFLTFAKQYSANFVVDESEILALHCDHKAKEIFDLVLPLILQTETYDVAKNILQETHLGQDSNYLCYQLLLEILLGAPESKITVLIEKLSKQEKNKLVQGTLFVVNSILDLDVQIPPLEIAREYEIDDEFFLMLVQKIQGLNYY